MVGLGLYRAGINYGSSLKSTPVYIVATTARIVRSQQHNYSSGICEMHELTIARSLIDLASEYAEEHQARAIDHIFVRLGVLSGMLRPLHFCFTSAARGTICEGAKLDIEEVAVTVECSHCGQVGSPVNQHSLRCPNCFSNTVKIVTGNEMQLVSIKVIENSDDHRHLS
jgi:hydrogenase nickel incorporation protein HypA/HybF